MLQMPLVYGGLKVPVVYCLPDEPHAEALRHFCR
jgi:hypothetical protein